MFERIIRFSITQSWIVMLAVLALAGVGIYSYRMLPIDAVPDITTVQVQINTAAPGYSPLETEQRITFPVETALSGLPRIEQIRSLSRYGLSQITVVFKEGTDLYFARQLITERIQEARSALPGGIVPLLGPTSTGLGEIYMWTVQADEGAKKADGMPYTPTDLRELQDWVVKPQLRTVPGVAEINSLGGYKKEYVILPDPAMLSSRGLTIDDIAKAFERNNANVGAGYIERKGEQYLIRVPGQVQSIDDIGNVLLAHNRSSIVRVRDVAQVRIGGDLRTGAATENGREVVLGTIFMLIGENSRAVAQAVGKRLAAVNKTLPPGVKAIPVYDRTNLVDRAIDTVKNNLLEGAVLVIVVLLVFLGNIRAALITALVIPLAMLFTFTGMVSYKVSANLLSLGALDFGIIIDGALVIVENCVRRLAHAQAAKGATLTRSERIQEVMAASNETRRALLYGQLIIMVVYLPLFTFAGAEGKMFRPMAITVLLALLGAMILSLTFVPAAVALLMNRPVQEQENVIVRTAKKYYGPILDRTFSYAPVVLTFAGVLVVFCGVVGTRLGSEFVPTLSEGDIGFLSLRVPGISLTQAIDMQQRLESRLKSRFPEIERVFTRIGTAEIATDAQGPDIADGYIMLKPEANWPSPKKSHDQLVSLIREEAEKLPGTNYEFSQPIQLRVNELISGVRSDVAVKVFGDDMAQLNASAQAIANVLEKIPGASEVKVEATSGLPMLTVQIDRNKAARYGLNVSDVQDVVSASVGGKDIGTYYQGDRRFDITVRLPENVRTDIDALKRLPVALSHADKPGEPVNFIALSEVASLDLAPGPNQISREQGKRRVVVTANVRGRDIGSFVTEAEARLQKQVAIPAGYWTAWGGTFEQLESASARLRIVLPVTLILVFSLLYAMFGNLKDGLLVFTGIPFALTGGVLALWARGIPFSISAAVGFIALSGVAVLNGLVMISYIRTYLQEGAPLREAVQSGAIGRLRPVLMTALVASLGFVPMAIATGAGAEVQRPLATVVIGGILSSTALTLLVLPLLFYLAHRQPAAKHQYDGDRS
jgi:cobalt-zinc-cadmium resistance protein CzcA